MKKKLFKVPVTWKMKGTLYILADSLARAEEGSTDDIPKNGEYVEYSLEYGKVEEVSEDVIEF
jgi:hypothetical protein